MGHDSQHPHIPASDVQHEWTFLFCIGVESVVKIQLGVYEPSVYDIEFSPAPLRS